MFYIYDRVLSEKGYIDVRLVENRFQSTYYQLEEIVA